MAGCGRLMMALLLHLVPATIFVAHYLPVGMMVAGSRRFVLL